VCSSDLLVVVLLTSQQILRCQSTGAPPAQTESSFVAAFRTSAHVKNSSPLVFDQVVDEVIGFLRSSDVALVNDPLRGPSNQIPRLQEDISREDLLAGAMDAGATYLLIITVDRPISQWMKVTVESYDLSGKMLWREIAGYSGWTNVNSKKALPEIMKKLGEQLSARFGKPGLPLIAPTEGQRSGQQPEPPTVAQDNNPMQTQQAPRVSGFETALIHITSLPSGGEIYVDGKFFGNTPSDITLPVGEHALKITIGGKEWSRTIEITPGEITVRADVTGQ
jgi:hypothetical protein